MKIIESSSYLPRAAAPAALPRRAFDSRAMTKGGSTGELVLTAPHPTSELPFLAQYLAQEFGAPDGGDTRFRQRDEAYRLAGSQPMPALLTLDV